MNKKAVVLLSGGIDSSVCLALAKSQGFHCYALSVDYNQRNFHELFCAALIAKQIGVVEHRISKCELAGWESSSLTNSYLKLEDCLIGKVNTYVPARNIIFLSLAFNWAESIKATDIFFAANAEDYANYPDCRPEFFASLVSIAHPLQIHTPLITLSKKEIIQQGQLLNVDFSLTFSCYDPINQAQPCQQCLACRLRIEGFAHVN